MYHLLPITSEKLRERGESLPTVGKLPHSSVCLKTAPFLERNLTMHIKSL